ncbi:MAG: hypothetical protein J6P61_01270 [Erysipelotrichaceae bacterium]|nr:hypothetical protein [Erysipelotrichaceae bacterium]
MKQNKNVTLYNILLPIWMLIFFPTPLWLILIPGNYLIDRFILKWSLGDMAEKGMFCRKHTWKICLVGFISDFIGAVLLFSLFMIFAQVKDESMFKTFLDQIEYGIGFNPFSNILGLIIILLSIACAGGLIYFFDHKILIKAGLTKAQAKKSALYLAVFTAPYLYLFPSELLYQELVHLLI